MLLRLHPTHFFAFYISVFRSQASCTWVFRSPFITLIVHLFPGTQLCPVFTLDHRTVVAHVCQGRSLLSSVHPEWERPDLIVIITPRVHDQCRPLVEVLNPSGSVPLVEWQDRIPRFLTPESNAARTQPPGGHPWMILSTFVKQ